MPFTLNRTKFELLVCNALMNILYGKVKIYQQLIETIRNKNTCRAVGLGSYNN